MKNLIITKSLFLLYCQCIKAFWLKISKPELASSDPFKELLFKQGYEVEALAKDSLRLKYRSVKVINLKGESTKKCVTLIKEAITSFEDLLLFEPTFQTEDGYHCRVDAIAVMSGNLTVYEIKSSSSFKSEHLLDLGYQDFVLNRLNLIIQKYNLVLVNPDYFREEELELQQHFVTEDLTCEVETSRSFIKNAVAELKKSTLEQALKEEIHEGCWKPYECAFQKECFKDFPKPSVLDISGVHKTVKVKLIKKNRITYDQIPEDFKGISENQWIQINTFLEGAAHIDKHAIRRSLPARNPSLGKTYLDYETFLSALCRFPRSGTMEQLPFQFSAHIITPEGDLHHSEFLADNIEKDFRADFLENLLDVGCKYPKSPIYTYNVKFERTVTKNLIRFSPKHAKHLEKLIERMEDVMVPFQKKQIWFANQHGYSIKDILPVITDLSYKDLKINNGALASAKFLEMCSLPNGVPREEIRTSLLEYCKLDTYSLYRVHSALENLIKA